MTRDVSVASLIPSATEILFDLGLDEEVVGVTFECDHPPGVRDRKPHVVTSPMPDGLTSGEIDAAVRESLAKGESLYRIDAARLEALRPDVLVTQSLCDVCAASRPLLDDALARLSFEPRVVTLTGVTLDGVLEDIRVLGDAVGRGPEADALVANLRGRLDAVATAVADAPRPRVTGVEWLDPPMACGHWMPDMIRLAGGEEALGRAGEHGWFTDWDTVVDAAPDVAVLMPCGFDAARTVDEARDLRVRDRLAGTRAVKDERVVAVDGGGLFSRPGPRLVDGVELLAHVLHPDRSPDKHPGGWRPITA